MAGQVPVHNAVHRVAQPTEVRFMEFSSNGELYVVCGSRTVKRWYGEQAVPQEIFSTDDPIHALLVRHADDYTLVFLGHDDGQIEMWGRNNLEENPPFTKLATLQTWRNNMTGHAVPAVMRNQTELNRVTCLCLSEDREFIYGASTKGAIYVWWIANDGKKKFVQRIDENDEVLSLAAGPNVVFSGSSDGHIRMYRREPGWLGTARHHVTHREIGTYRSTFRIPTRVTALVFETRVGDATRGRLYAGSSDGRVRCWNDLRVDVRTAWPVPEIMVHQTYGVTCLALCSDRFLLSVHYQKIWVWRRHGDNANHTIEVVLANNVNGINCIAKFHEQDPDRWIVYGGSLDAIRIWHVPV